MSRICSFNRCFIWAALLIVSPWAAASGVPQHKPNSLPIAPTDNVLARRKLVSQLSHDSSMSKRVLDAMADVPREQFCLPEDEGRAYSNTSLPIGYGQSLVAPYLQAYMLSALNLKSSDNVLEVGTGSGYLTAVLSKLARQVYTIEIVEPLARSAQKTLARLGCKNSHCKSGDGYLGWPDKGPFQAIIITAGAPNIPKPLLDQLAIGGRLVLPIGEQSQVVTKVVRTANGIKEEKLIPAYFAPMTGQAAKQPSELTKLLRSRLPKKQQ